MVLSRTSGPKFSGMGFTLVEVLVALLLCTVPVVAAQRLMFRAADSVRFTTQQALAERAATNTLNRIYAFHVVGLWPARAACECCHGLVADDGPHSLIDLIRRFG